MFYAAQPHSNFWKNWDSDAFGSADAAERIIVLPATLAAQQMRVAHAFTRELLFLHSLRSCSLPEQSGSALRRQRQRIEVLRQLVRLLELGVRPHWCLFSNSVLVLRLTLYGTARPPLP